MFKALRQTKAKLAATGTASGADADDTKTVAEIRAAALTLKRTLGYYYKSFLDHNANTAALHEDVANLYPASERLSMAVATLNQGSNIFHDSAALVEEMKSTIERPLDALVALCDETLSKIERRAAARAEIEYYKSKVVALANEAKASNDAKKEAKAEQNQAKLQAVQKEFRELQDEVSATLSRMDAEVATRRDELRLQISALVEEKCSLEVALSLHHERLEAQVQDILWCDLVCFPDTFLIFASHLLLPLSFKSTAHGTTVVYCSS